MKRRQPGALTTVLLILLATVGSSTYAAAAEKTADLGKYCRKVHGRDAFANIDRRDDGLMCTRRTDGGLGLLHRKIKAADVCAAQYRTQRFRRQGKGLICITGSGGPTQAAKTVDLAKHCRAKYGPKAFVTRRRTDDRPMCTIRTDRGLGLRHHLIDLAGLCGGGAPRAVGNKLKCSQSSAGTTTGGGGPGTTPGGGTGTGTKPPGGALETSLGKPGPLPRPGRVGGGALTWADMRGCGGFGPTAKRLTAQFAKWNPPRGKGWNRGGTQLPCSRLAGGRVVDLAKYCRVRRRWAVGKSFVPSPPPYDTILHWADGKWPVCVKRLYAADPKQYWRPLRSGYMDLSEACTWGSGRTYKSSKPRFQVAFRYTNRRLECFYFKKARYFAIWKARQTDVAPDRIEFVAADPPRKVLTRLHLGLRFFVRLVYKGNPGADTQPVTLRQPKSGARIRLTAKRVKRSNVFETEVVRLTRKVKP